MKDALPILAFKVAPAQFDIASAQSFISLRDQAVRVRTLLGAMETAGLFRPAGIRVLVVGAGYAGVNASFWLAERGIGVTLIDKESVPFSVQRSCSTRYLSLTQYDWPGSHHARHDYPQGLTPAFFRYPWLGPPPVGDDHLLTSGVKLASDHAADWDQQFRAKLGPPLTWLPGTWLDPSSVRRSRGKVSVVLHDNAGPLPGRFDYLLYAAGFGSDGAEITRLGSGTQATPGFWSNDELADPSKPPPKRILISGSGDGGIQDFIRVVVNPQLTTASAVLAEIIRYMRRNSATHADAIEAAWRRVASMVMYAEAQAGAAAEWWGEAKPELWAELDRQHRAAARRLAKPWGALLVEALAHVMDRATRANELTVVFPAKVPGKVYGLNRFLFILLSEYLQYVRSSRYFLGMSPRITVPLNGVPKFDLLLDHRLDINASWYDPGKRVYHAKVDAPGWGVVPVLVDALIVRHGTRKPPPLGVRVGLHQVRLGLGRIRLPYAAVE